MDARLNERGSKARTWNALKMNKPEIINRVANSALITIDLEDYYPKGERILFDIKPLLWQEFVLKEKDFRQFIKENDWSVYQDKFVAVYNTADAIVPSWAYMLISTYLQPFAKKTIIGSLKDLETALYSQIIANLNIDDYSGKPVIIKGCANKCIPETAYIQLIEKIQPVVNSIMFGEACSTVPLFKRKK
mgnify:CR=1 FL=1